MTNRWFNPNEQFYDNAGEPISGGLLYFYASGTDTPQNTYSDSGLTIPNANPVVLDSAGRCGSIFLSQLAYKVTLADATDAPIWTEDPVWTSDYSTVAQFAISNGNPNGSVAGTAGTFGGRPSSVMWDNVNNVLYVCTTSGTASTAVWTAVNVSSIAASSISIPQGYLTPTSGVPIITGDVTSAPVVYYTPLTGNTAPVFNGTAFSNTTFAELVLTLSSSQAGGTLYDVFMFVNSGVATLAAGPAWSNSSAGSCSRGTGAGTTQLQLLNGIYVNSVQITGRNASTTYTIPANQATYLGSLAIDAAAGQVSCFRSYGQSRKWGIWNAYNKQPLYLKAGDATSSWVYNTATYRPSNNSTANSLTVFSGLPTDVYDLGFLQLVQTAGTSVATSGSTGIGFNSTTTPAGTHLATFTNTSATGYTFQITSQSSYLQPPTLGINTITALETASAQAVTTFFGTETNMSLTARWRG